MFDEIVKVNSLVEIGGLEERVKSGSETVAEGPRLQDTAASFTDSSRFWKNPSSRDCKLRENESRAS